MLQQNSQEENVFYKSKSNRMRSSRRKEPAKSLSYRFEIYLCTKHLLFFLTWRLYLYAHPACLPACRFSHFLLFHLLFCLQQLIIPSFLFHCFAVFFSFLIHSSYLFCSVLPSIWPPLYPPSWCGFAYLRIKCIFCRRENCTPIQMKAAQMNNRWNADVSVLHMDAVAAGAPIYFSYCWRKNGECAQSCFNKIAMHMKGQNSKWKKISKTHSWKMQCNDNNNKCTEIYITKLNRDQMI